MQKLDLKGLSHATREIEYDRIINKVKEEKQTNLLKVNKINRINDRGVRVSRVTGAFRTNDEIKFTFREYYRDNKNLFIRNLYIKNLKLDDFMYIKIFSRCEEIDSIFSFMYPVIVKEFSNNFDNFDNLKGDNVILPFKEFPLEIDFEIHVHLIDKDSKKTENILENIEVIFDLYEMSKNSDSLNEILINQTQFCGIEVFSCTGTNKFRLNFNHVSKLLGFKIEGPIPKNIKFVVKMDEKDYYLDLIPSYILDNIYVFKFDEYINFSRLNDVKIYVDVDNQYGKFYPFCLSLNLYKPIYANRPLVFY